jgi:hypothetical protein
MKFYDDLVEKAGREMDINSTPVVLIQWSDKFGSEKYRIVCSYTQSLHKEPVIETQIGIDAMGNESWCQVSWCQVTGCDHQGALGALAWYLAEGYITLSERIKVVGR